MVMLGGVSTSVTVIVDDCATTPLTVVMVTNRLWVPGSPVAYHVREPVHCWLPGGQGSVAPYLRPSTHSWKCCGASELAASTEPVTPTRVWPSTVTPSLGDVTCTWGAATPT